MNPLEWLYPLEWVVAALMVLWHNVLTFLGLEPAGGAAWGLSIVGLVVTIRILLIPLFVKQIKASRAMQVIAPELKAVQAKYKGKKDQASREAMSRETMELYSKHKTNPFASCLPILVQAPIFFALFRVLNNRLNPPEGTDAGIGLLTPELAAQAEHATIFGAQLSDTFLRVPAGSAAQYVSAILIAMMVATTFITQRQLMRKNMPKAALEGPMARQQQLIMYALPFIFIITGPNFPVGVLIYWTTTNLWTMGQQFYVIRRNPTPGSEAERVLLEKRAAKETARAIKRGETTPEQIEAERQAELEEQRKQRQQPKRTQPRSKRKGGPQQKAIAGGEGGSDDDGEADGADTEAPEPPESPDEPDGSAPRSKKPKK